MIDEAGKRDILFRIVISPDPNKEDQNRDLNMREITEQTMLKIEEIRDNMETQIYYRPSNLETAQFIEHSLGRRSEYARSQTTRERLRPRACQNRECPL
jgi:hypothetical protein